MEFTIESIQDLIVDFDHASRVDSSLLFEASRKTVELLRTILIYSKQNDPVESYKFTELKMESSDGF